MLPPEIRVSRLGAMDMSQKSHSLGPRIRTSTCRIGSCSAAAAAAAAMAAKYVCDWDRNTGKATNWHPKQVLLLVGVGSFPVVEDALLEGAGALVSHLL